MTITTKKLTLSITIATILIATTLILGTIGLATNQAFAADNGITGNIFGIQATIGTAKIQEYDPITHLKVSEFSVPTSSCNGRGLAFDGQDLWYTCVGFPGFSGDGIIHKIATTGGADITTIPDPYGLGARGVGAMDIHSVTGNLWITSYLPINNQEEISEIDLNTGNVLASCNIPFGGGGAGSETLVVDETAGTFLSNGGEANQQFIDEYTLPVAVNQGNCALVANFNPTANVIGGVDFDGAGNLVEGSFNSIENLGVRPFNAIIGSSFSTEIFFEDITFLTEVGPTQKVCESDVERICKDVRTNDEDGDGQIEVGELVTFEMTIKLTNPAPFDWVDTIVKDRFGAELELVDCRTSQGDVDISTKGKSEKVFLEWDVGTVPKDGGMATLTCTLQTDLNPAGMQEYSSPGEYDFNSGANVKFNAGEDGKQVSFETPSIEVTVTEAD